MMVVRSSFRSGCALKVGSTDFRTKYTWDVRERKQVQGMTPPESNLTHCLLNLPGLPIIYYKQ